MPKNADEGTFCAFLLSSWLQFGIQFSNTKQPKRGLFGDNKTFREKSHKVEKTFAKLKEEHSLVQKKFPEKFQSGKWDGPFYIGMASYFMLEAVDAFKMKY